MTLRQRIGAAIPYIILVITVLPIFVGYAWLVINSFSVSTEGLRSTGFTLSNWSFLREPPFGRGYPSIWRVTLNTFMIAVSMTFFVVVVSSLAGYALSRQNFRGRKTFLSGTLVLHAFPSVTLLIGIFFVLRTLKLYNTTLGVGLVMIGFELPFGIWLMKGFFDNVSWDMERAALSAYHQTGHCGVSHLRFHLRLERLADPQNLHHWRRPKRDSICLFTELFRRHGGCPMGDGHRGGAVPAHSGGHFLHLHPGPAVEYLRWWGQRWHVIRFPDR